MQRLLRNERAMLRWMLKVKIEDNVSLSTMCAKLNLAPLQSNLRLNRLRWYGHVVRSENWINSCFHLEVDSFKGRGHPRKTWIETINKDLKEWNIDSDVIKDRPIWKNNLKTAMKSPTCGNCGMVAQIG